MEFSILMSVYQKEKPEFLKDSIDSIISQKILPKELIIVEDGPLTPELYEVLDKACEHNCKTIIKRVCLFKNGGLGNALNEGLKHCTTQWIGRMDSDDICNEDRFKITVDTIIENGNNFDIVGGHIDEFNSENFKYTGSRRVCLNHKEIIKDFKNRNPMNHVTIFFKLKSIVKAGGYKDFLYFEDYDLWARMASMGMKFYNIDKPLVNVRVGKDMIGRRRGWFYMRQEIKMQFKLYNLGLTPFTFVVRNIFFRGLGRFLPKIILTKLYKLYRS